MKPIAQETAAQVVEETLAPLRGVVPDSLLAVMREELMYGLLEHPGPRALVERAGARVVPERSGLEQEVGPETSEREPGQGTSGGPG
jgi:hypothetical protein